MSQSGGGFTNYLSKGRQVETGMEASKRRHVWEMYDDVRVINKFLLFYAVTATLTMGVMASVIFAIYTRPPYILTQDQGYIMWRTTEVFKLKPDMISSFLSLTLGKIYNKSPGAYDLSSVSTMIGGPIIDALVTEHLTDAAGRRTRNQRDFFDILEIKFLPVSRFPQYPAFIARGNLSVSQQTRDSAGNIVTQTTAETIFVTAWLEQVMPTPENPWGLVLVGLLKQNQAEGQASWDQSEDLENARTTKEEDAEAK